MCLERLAKWYEKPLFWFRRTGYKVFVTLLGQKGLYSEMQGTYAYPRPEGEWIDEWMFRDKQRRTPDAKINLGYGKGKYRPGWHIFLTKKGLENWLGHSIDMCDYAGVRKVKFGTVTAKGFQGKHRCVVASMLYILPKEAK